MFYLYKQDDSRLFIFGKDIWIGKKGFGARCYQDDDCLYDYTGNEKALTGIIGSSNEFKLKRIIVVQFQ